MRVTVFGLGIFGRIVAKALYEYGHEVIAIDQRKELVQKVQEYTTQAVVANCTDRELIENLGLDAVDIAIITLGADIGASILLTLYLKEMNIKRIIVKAINEDHQKILKTVGATEVIFPEKDMALKLATSLDAPNVLDYLPLTKDYEVIEITAPTPFIGKSLGKLDLRKRYGIQVIAIRKAHSEELCCLISPDHVIETGDILIILGRIEDIEKVKKIADA